MLSFLIFSLIVAGSGFVHAEDELPPEEVAGVEARLPEGDPLRADRTPAVLDAPTDEPTGENVDLYTNLD